MNKKVDIIGIQMDLGASMRGVDMGASAIRHADFLKGLEKLGVDYNDKGDIIPMQEGKSIPSMKHYEQINEANGRLYKEVKESLENNRMPIILGGDHCVAAGSIPAIAEHYNEIGIIWVDAHGDFNSDESSESGNMHGMPFSAVCGQGPEAMIPFSDKRVDPRKCVQIAARDVDDEERVRMKAAGVNVFSIADVDKLGMPEVIKRAIEIAGATGHIHVSFDLDAVTPDEAPGVGTPVHSGLSVRESFLIMEELYDCDKVVSCDMVEVNPILDERNKTGKLASELILALLGKAVF